MEQFVNEASAALDGAINNSVTSITVKNGVRLPASGTFRARIDDELLIVTAVAGTTTWTVTRGAEGSTAASHSDSAAIYVIVTARAMDAIVSVEEAGTEIANSRSLNFTDATVADDAGRVNITTARFETIIAPMLANFTLDGHSIPGTPTATQQGRSIVIWHPGTSTVANVELYQSPPPTPYTVIAKLTPFSPAWGSVSACLYLGDGTKLQRLGMQLQNNQLIVDRYSSWNAFATSILGATDSMFSRTSWFRITDSGSTQTFSISPDGQAWLQIWSQASNAYLTTSRVGICLNGNTGVANGGRIAALILESWEVQ